MNFFILFRISPGQSADLLRGFERGRARVDQAAVLPAPRAKVRSEVSRTGRLHAVRASQLKASLHGRKTLLAHQDSTLSLNRPNLPESVDLRQHDLITAKPRGGRESVKRLYFSSYTSFPAGASWQSGDAAVCKAVYTGSIPVLASNGFAVCPGGGMVDARDLKSLGLFARAGSSPAPGTTTGTTMGKR